MAFDPYRILGVERDASVEEIRQIYRSLARRYHPDLNKSPDAEEVFKDLGVAFGILTDERKRQLFDQYGEAALQVGFDPRQYEQPSPRRQGPPERSRRPTAATSAPQHHPAPTRDRPERIPPGHGLDLLVPLPIDLLTAIAGGQVRAPSPLTGAPLSVTVPAGADSGHQIRLEGRGRPGRGRQPGDLYFEIQIEPHPFFHREGHDLVLELPVTIEEAYFGARIQIPTLDGWVRLGIPANSRGGERLRLRGKGLPDDQGGRGDMHVHVCVRLPDRIDALGRNLDRIGALYTESVREGLRL